ncbi:MucBP domain-containing protein, partial [Vagococcus fessus]|uniref:MucBP domain-containing protein n=1 Tax=Vagococcus fessus TaxID=120370 RepID=UPI0039EA56B7
MKRLKKSMLGILIANLVAPSLALASPTTENRDAYSKETETVKKTETYEEKKVTLKAKKEKDPSKEPEKVDYELLIDGSGSMRDTGSLDKTKEAINHFIDERNPKYERVGVSVFRGPGYDSVKGEVVYDAITKTLSDYSSDFSKVKEAVNTMEAGGLTPLYDGLDYVLPKMNETSRDDARKVLIIFADGHPNIGPERDYFVGISGEEEYRNDASNYPSTTKYAKELSEKIEKMYEAGDYDSPELFELEDEKNKLETDYPIGMKRPLTGYNEKLKGRLYENHKQEFYDLMSLIEGKADGIKQAGYEVFTVYLDNSSKDPNSKVVNDKGEAEGLFRRISTDTAHYLPAENVSLLPEMFEKINDSMTKFVYNINDTIEEGFTLMPETIKENHEGVKVNHSDEKIEWNATAVDYDELTVSYHIYREIDPTEKMGELVVNHVTEDGKVLKEPISSTEKVGTAYSTEKQSFDGYEFVKLSDDSGKPAGEYVEGTTEVTYIYKKIEAEPEEKFGSLVVRHITEDGKELAPITGTTEKVGTEYNTHQQTFAGYEFVKYQT